MLFGLKMVISILDGVNCMRQSPSKTTPTSGSFTIPSSATTGSTRMRISMKQKDLPLVSFSHR
jgi:hypothetical protein